MHKVDERRESKRFTVLDQTAFVINTNWPDKGVLIDISKGGCAFQYISDTPWPESSKDTLMVLGNHDSFIADVSAEVVADQIVQCGNGNSMIVRRRSLKFGKLTEQQEFMLQCFIWVNAAVLC